MGPLKNTKYLGIPLESAGVRPQNLWRPAFSKSWDIGQTGPLYFMC